MKPHLFASLLLVASTTMGTVSIARQPVMAQSKPVQDTKFHCGQFQGAPATIASTPRGDVVMVRWTKDMGTFDPQSRCQAVSTRFQTAYTNKTLRFLTSGVMNGQRVICVAQSRTGGCAPSGLLFTLRPTDNHRQVLVGLINQSRYASTPPILQNCVPKQQYDVNFDVVVDLNEILYQCPAEDQELVQPQY
jgi:Circadian oscillating protein COP23